MSCTLWGAVDGLDWAGWAGRHQSWLPATSLISRSMSCCKWHQFDLALSTVELLAIFSHTSNQAPEGKVLMWPGYTTGFLKITPWLIIHHWSSGPKLLHNFMCAMGSLSQRSHKAGWVVRKKKKSFFLFLWSFVLLFCRHRLGPLDLASGRKVPRPLPLKQCECNEPIAPRSTECLSSALKSYLFIT